MDMELYGIINTIVSVFLGGGWFLHWRATKRKAYGEAKQTEAQANKEAQEYYNNTLADVNRTLNEVRADRDRYKDQRDKAWKDNDEMREKYNEIEDRMDKMDREYKKEIFRLSRRIDVLSPFLCGVAGCMHRKKVSLMEDNSFDSIQTETEPKNNNNDGNTQKGK